MRASSSSLEKNRPPSVKNHSLRSSKDAFMDHRSLFPGIEEGSDIRRYKEQLDVKANYDGDDMDDIGDRHPRDGRSIFLVILFNVLQIFSVVGGFLLIAIWAHFGIKYNLFFHWALILGMLAIITHTLGMASLFWRSRKMGLIYLLMVLGSVLLYAYLIFHISTYGGQFEPIYGDKWNSLSVQERTFIESQVITTIP